MKLLHIDSSSKGRLSNSRSLSQYFINALSVKYPSLIIDYLDLAENPLPHIGETFVNAIYKPDCERTEAMRQALRLSDQLCQQLISADAIVLGIPMHNWCYPSLFKAYIDHITRLGLTYELDNQGNVIGKLKQKKLLFITTRGADLREESPYASMDVLTPALKAAFGFIGVEDMTFVNAQPLQFANQTAHLAALEKAKNTLLSLTETWL